MAGGAVATVGFSFSRPCYAGQSVRLAALGGDCGLAGERAQSGADGRRTVGIGLLITSFMRTVFRILSFAGLGPTI